MGSSELIVLKRQKILVFWMNKRMMMVCFIFDSHNFLTVFFQYFIILYIQTAIFIL